MKNDFEFVEKEVHIKVGSIEGEKVVRISKDDFELVSSIKGTWYASSNNKNGKCYVHTKIDRDGKYRSVALHRMILNLHETTEFSHIHVDHLDHDSLNNTRENLLATTRRRNTARKQDFILVKKEGTFWVVKKGETILCSCEDRNMAQIMKLIQELVHFPFLSNFKSYKTLFEKQGIDYEYIQINLGGLQTC